MLVHSTICILLVHVVTGFLDSISVMYLSNIASYFRQLTLYASVFSDAFFSFLCRDLCCVCLRLVSLDCPFVIASPSVLSNIYFSQAQNDYPSGILTSILFMPFGFIAPKTLNYLAFQSFDLERTCTAVQYIELSNMNMFAVFVKSLLCY
jgi:hypothetical protein